MSSWQELDDPLSRSCRALRPRRKDKEVDDVLSLSHNCRVRRRRDKEADDALSLSHSSRVRRARNVKVAAAPPAPASKATDDKEAEKKAEAGHLYRRRDYAAEAAGGELADPLSRSARVPRSRRREAGNLYRRRDYAAESAEGELADPLSRSARAPRSRRGVPARRAPSEATDDKEAENKAEAGHLYRRRDYAAEAAGEELADPLSRSARVPRSRRRETGNLYRRRDYAAESAEGELADPLSRSSRAPRSRRGVPARRAPSEDELGDALSRSARVPRSRRGVPARRVPSEDEVGDPLSRSVRAPRSRRGVPARRAPTEDGLQGLSQSERGTKPTSFRRRVLRILKGRASRSKKGTSDTREQGN